MADWLRVLAELGAAGVPSVVVTVAEAQGSTPREAGTKMIVTGEGQFGTIGGGHLEFRATEIARDLIGAGGGQGEPVTLRHFPLGPALGQCCGGAATLGFEYLPAESFPWVNRLVETLEAGPCVAVSVTGRAAVTGAKLVVTEAGAWGELPHRELTAAATARARALLAGQGGVAAPLLDRIPGAGGETDREGPALLFERLGGGDFDIVLFGAGHVGNAVIPVIQGLPCRISWFDSRPGLFPDPLPGNVRAEVVALPEYEVDRCPSGAYFLVMTHSHPLDYALTERLLERGDFRYLGLIGSRTKRNRLERRLMRKGFSRNQLDRLTCPIGIDGITGKHPTEIAVAVAAEMLRLREIASKAAGPVAVETKPV